MAAESVNSGAAAAKLQELRALSQQLNDHRLHHVS